MSTNETDPGGELSLKQRKALPHLAASGSLAEGARKANIGRTTVYRWMEDDDFRSELTRLHNEAAELAQTELKGMMLDSAIVIREALADDNASVRLRAAEAALNLALKTLHGLDIEKRINRLSDAVELSKERPF